VEVDSSDTDDDDVVFREVLRASKQEAGDRLKDDAEGARDEKDGAESDAVEDSDADSDADPRLLPKAPEFTGAGTKRPRVGVSVANRASGNAPAEKKPSAGTEVDAKRGRRSEGFGSAPDLHPESTSAGESSDSDARSLTSASELCLGSPSSATSG
jgi:hypothetical protein